MRHAECSICQEILDLFGEEHISALQCGHTFHANCIKTWLNSSRTCPQCRLSAHGPNQILRLFFSRLNEYSTMQCGSDTSKIDDIASARSEIECLRELLVEAKSRAKQAENKIADQANEICTLSQLYRETDQLYCKEREKLNQLRKQLVSYGEVLKQTQSMQDECIHLRQQMEELRDIETLVKSNEAATTELIAKYQDQNGSYAPETINNLFRWVTILRAELSESRSRTQKYRADAHRLRKAQAAAALRSSDLQRALDRTRARLASIETEMAQLCDEKRRPSDSVASPSTPTAVTSAETSSAANESHLGLKHCLTFIDMSTPEPNFANAFKLHVDASLTDTTNVTPRVNPFKTASTPSAKKSRNDKQPPTEERESADLLQSSSRVGAERRPSSLFRLAIMRDFGKKTGSFIKPFSALIPPYNGLGGTETNTGPTSLFERFTKPKLVRNISHLPSKRRLQ